MDRVLQPIVCDVSHQWSIPNVEYKGVSHISIKKLLLQLLKYSPPVSVAYCPLLSSPTEWTFCDSVWWG